MKAESPPTPKPILAIYLNATPEKRSLALRDLPQELKEEYHVLILFSLKNDIKVFFQKDQVELDQKMLEELLSIHKR